MKIGQKRNCNSCLALEINQGHINRCELGYLLRVEKKGECFGRQIVNIYPIEPCPKPKTVSQYHFATRHLTKQTIQRREKKHD